MNHLYLVFGSTGEWSDHTIWNVAVYGDEDRANEHAKLANAFVKKAKQDLLLTGALWESLDKSAKNNPYDIDCQIDYTGADYSVAKIPFVRHVDEYMELMPEIRLTRKDVSG